MIPNGVEVPPQTEKENFASTGADRMRSVVFLSRLHPKKGLLNLVKAWAQVQPADWRVTIAGPDEDGHRADVTAAIHAAGLDEEFTFTGPIQGKAKWDLLRQADLFVLPTFSENFGIVIAEALACGVPVITTKAAPWTELMSQQCGWWVDVGVEPLANALRSATALPDSDRREMGLRGRCLVEQRYSWARIATEMRSVYEWVLGMGTKPACVLIN